MNYNVVPPNYFNEPLPEVAVALNGTQTDQQLRDRSIRRGLHHLSEMPKKIDGVMFLKPLSHLPLTSDKIYYVN